MCPNDEPPAPAKTNRDNTDFLLGTVLHFCITGDFFHSEKRHINSPGTFAILKSSLSPSAFCTLPLPSQVQKWRKQELLEVLISLLFSSAPCESLITLAHTSKNCVVQLVHIVQRVETKRCLLHRPTEHLQHGWSNISPSSVGRRYTSLQMVSGKTGKMCSKRKQRAWVLSQSARP